MKRYLKVGLAGVFFFITLWAGAKDSAIIYFSETASIPEEVRIMIARELGAGLGETWRICVVAPQEMPIAEDNAVFVLTPGDAKNILPGQHSALERISAETGEAFAIMATPPKERSAQFVIAKRRRMLIAGAFYLARQIRLNPARFGKINALEKPYYEIRITNDAPLNAIRWGYNTVESKWGATSVALFDNAKPPIFKKGDAGYKRTIQNRAALKEFLALADALNLDTIAYGDEFQFPRELVESDYYRPLVTERGFTLDELKSEWGMGRIFCFAKPILWKLYCEKYREIFRHFPSLDYVQLRLGENTTFGKKKPYAGSGVYSLGGAPYCADCKNITYTDRIAGTIRETYGIAVKEFGKKYIHRTWDTRYDTFNNNPDVFTKIASRLPETRGLYFSTKYTFGDFWEYFDYNPTLSAPPPIPRIVEFQCTREYEGKGAFPNFLSEEFCAAHRHLRNLPVCGVSNWHHGGGRGGPFPELDIWNQANIYAAARLSWEPDTSPEKLAHEFATFYFGKRAADRIAKLLLLSDDAVRKWRYFRIYSEEHKNKTPAELWIRDDVIRGDTSLYKIYKFCTGSTTTTSLQSAIRNPHSVINALLAEKKDAIDIVDKMIALHNLSREDIITRQRIYLPWGTKSAASEVGTLHIPDSSTSDPLYISGRDLFDFTETSLQYERALAVVLYHYCGAYFYAQVYRRSLDPKDKAFAQSHLKKWEAAWKYYNAEIPKLKFCPSLFRDDGMVATLKRARYYLDNPAILDLEWRIIGPFANPHKKGFDIVYPPERELDFSKEYDGLNQKVRWRPLPEDHHIDDLVDLTKVFSPDDWITMYAYSEVYSPRDEEVVMQVGSDDAIKIWINGKLVHAHNIYRAAKPGQDTVRVNLKKGRNKILVKLMEGIFGCGFYLQFTTPEGKPVPGLRGLKYNR